MSISCINDSANHGREDSTARYGSDEEGGTALSVATETTEGQSKNGREYAGLCVVSFFSLRNAGSDRTLALVKSGDQN